MRQWVIALLLVSTSHAYAESTKLPAILQQVMPAIVHLTIELKPSVKVNKQGRPMVMQRQSHGSGVILNAEKGLIITNAHVVEGHNSITVSLSNGDRLIGHCLGMDALTDLALVHIDAQGLKQLEINRHVEVGLRVTAIGTPFGLEQTVTSGIVSATNRNIGLEGIENFIQTDAPINEGNSGGALIDTRGRLVGINTAILSKNDGGSLGIGFAIPMTMVEAIAKQIVTYGDVKHGMLGVSAQTMTPSLAEALEINDIKGVLVTNTRPNSPAEAAGLKAEDIITHMDEQEIKNATNLQSMIAVQRPETEVKLTVIRDKKTKIITAKLQDPKTIKEVKSTFPLAGLRLMDYKELDPHGNIILGIQVHAVHQGSAAWLSGLHAGDVILSLNHQNISTIEDAKQKMSTIKKYPLLVKVLRQHEEYLIVLKKPT